MAFVVTEPCPGCKHRDCVVVCPMDCFYEDESMLYIADDCINGGACVPECPVEAIFAPDDVPEQWASYIPLNLERSATLKAQGVSPRPKRCDAIRQGKR